MGIHEGYDVEDEDACTGHEHTYYLVLGIAFFRCLDGGL